MIVLLCLGDLHTITYIRRWLLGHLREHESLVSLLWRPCPCLSNASVMRCAHARSFVWFKCFAHDFVVGVTAANDERTICERWRTGTKDDRCETLEKWLSISFNALCVTFSVFRKLLTREFEAALSTCESCCNRACRIYDHDSLNLLNEMNSLNIYVSVFFLRIVSNIKSSNTCDKTFRLKQLKEQSQNINFRWIDLHQWHEWIDIVYVRHSYCDESLLGMLPWTNRWCSVGPCHGVAVRRRQVRGLNANSGFCRVVAMALAWRRVKIKYTKSHLRNRHSVKQPNDSAASSWSCLQYPQ